MDEDYLNINIQSRPIKASFEEIDTSMTSARNLSLKPEKLPNDLLQTHLEALKDQDQEFNDHFAPIYQAEPEKVAFLGNPLAQSKPVHADNGNSFFILQQKQLLQRDLSQNQRTFGGGDGQRQMKIVMSEPKFANPGLLLSNSSQNLRHGLNIPLKHEHQMGNNCGFDGGMPQNIGSFNDNLQSGANAGKGQAELQEEHDSALRKQKGNVKNTYIKKINSLMNLSRVEDVQARNKNERPQHAHQHPKKLEFKEKEDASSKEINMKSEKESHFKRSISYNSNLSSSNNPNQNKKLERNRESARNSRQRKKMYIELLENKVNQLTSEIDETKQILEQNNENFNSICHNSKYLNSLVVGRQQLFEKLEKAFSQEKPDEYQISLLIDSFRLRLGASGRERVKSIDYFFEQIVENFLPSSLKYLLLNASQQEQEVMMKCDSNNFNANNNMGNTMSNIHNMGNNINNMGNNINNLAALNHLNENFQAKNHSLIGE